MRLVFTVVYVLRHQTPMTLFEAKLPNSVALGSCWQHQVLQTLSRVANQAGWLPLTVPK